MNSRREIDTLLLEGCSPQTIGVLVLLKETLRCLPGQRLPLTHIPYYERSWNVQGLANIIDEIVRCGVLQSDITHVWSDGVIKLSNKRRAAVMTRYAQQ